MKQSNFIKRVQHMSGKYSSRIIFIHIVMLITVGWVYYPLLPLLLNYPPIAFENQEVYLKIYGITYTEGYAAMLLSAVLAYMILLRISLNGIDDWENLKNVSECDSSKIQKIRKKCLYTPYTIFILEIITLMILLVLLEIFYLVFSTSPGVIFVKLSVLLFSFITLSATISFIISKKYYTNILLKTSIDHDLGKKISLRSKIFLQIIPTFMMAILFTALIGYSRMIDEKGNLLFKIYNNKLIQVFSDSYQVISQDQLETDIQKISLESSKDKWFIISPKGKTIVSDDSKLSKHFTIFLKYLGDKYNGKTYQETAEVQGATIKVRGATGDIWTVGIQYEVSSQSIVIYILFSALALLVLAVVVLYYFSKTLSDDISLISSSLTEIAEGEDVHLEKKIAVTSNDEIGDLVVSFNKVQEREKKYVQNIKEHQKIIMERERLVSLGQMLGGITHNLKSPVASIAGFIDRLEELAVELEDTAADESVTAEDRLDIVKDLKNDLDEMKPYCSYISNLLTMVKDKAVQLNTSTDQSFTIAEVQARIMLLMNFELKNNNCVLKTEIKLDPQSIIKGEINNLVQVINNIILNSIQAYEGQGGTIDLIIEKQADNKIVFTITDYALGIPDEVQKKLLQEMVTTKGVKGSGLGLYLSRLTIKGRFGGDLNFRSKVGQGTTFHVIIPYQQSDVS